MGSLKNKCKQTLNKHITIERVPNLFLGMRDLPFLKGGIWDFNETVARFGIESPHAGNAECQK